MKLAAFFMSSLISSLIYSQVGITSYPINVAHGDTLDVKLVDIKSSPLPFYFRFYRGRQTVDIYGDGKSNFEGEVINSIKRYEYFGKGIDTDLKAVELHTQTVQLDSSAVQLAAFCLMESGQAEIPTDSLIPNWKTNFFHCGGVRFDFRIDSTYTEQVFHCPYGQADSLQYAQTVLSNYEYLIDQLRLDSLYSNFWSSLPKGNTYSSNAYAFSYIMSDEEEESWEKDKPRRQHLKSIKDSVDAIIKDHVWRQNLSFDKIECYGQYFLIFKRNGKLKKVKVSDDIKPDLYYGLGEYISDYLEMKKCKKLVTKTMRDIDFSSINSGHNIYRSFRFNPIDKFVISDPTIY